MLLLLLVINLPGSASDAAAGDPLLMRGVGTEGVSGAREPVVEAPVGASEAYVTLCYWDTYLLGVRVLGRSLRESGSTRDMVVLVTTTLSDDAKRTLWLDGWIVREVELVHNPGMGPEAKGKGGFPPRFWAVYTKLAIFSMITYDKLVYLDADVLVLENLDHLFQCVGFCAVMRGGERFNSGVMVIEPDLQVYEDMMHRIATTPSYTGGDQGFLNEYYRQIVDSPLFRLPLLSNNSTQGVTAMRLTTDLNSDVGAYIINSGQWHHSTRPKVLHYTLGPFKPWHWWMGWVAEQHSLWLEVRMRLGADVHGYAHGERWETVFARPALTALPILLWAWLLWQRAWPAGLQHLMASGVDFAGRRRVGVRAWGSGLPGAGVAALLASWARGTPTQCSAGMRLGSWSSGGSVVQHPTALPVAASALGIASLLASLAFAVFYVIPHDLDPLTAWTLVYEWAYLGLSVAMARFFRTAYKLGYAAVQAQEQQQQQQESGGLTTPRLMLGGEEAEHRSHPLEPLSASHKGHSVAVLRAWRVTMSRTLLAAAAITVAPWVARLCQIHDIVAKILITALSGVFAILLLVHALGDMAAVWFTTGVADAQRWKAGE
eukprot:jgi/Tetstr1/466440/TSEL_010968.t1